MELLPYCTLDESHFVALSFFKKLIDFTLLSFDFVCISKIMPSYVKLDFILHVKLLRIGYTWNINFWKLLYKHYEKFQL